MFRKAIPIVYSVLSLFVGLFGIVKWAQECIGNGMVFDRLLNVFLCAIVILAPVVILIATNHRRIRTLSSIKERFIEDNAVLPSTLSYLIDTISKKEIINKSVKVGSIIERIEIENEAIATTSSLEMPYCKDESRFCRSTITRIFLHMSSSNNITEINIRCNHHIFAETKDYDVSAKYGELIEGKPDNYDYRDPYQIFCTEISKSTMNIRIVFGCMIKKKTDFSITLTVSHKTGDIDIRDTIETFPIDPERLFRSWDNLCYIAVIKDIKLAESRRLRLVAYRRPSLRKQVLSSKYIIESFLPNEETELSIARNNKSIRKDSIYILEMLKKDL